MLCIGGQAKYMIRWWFEINELLLCHSKEQTLRNVLQKNNTDINENLQ